jgi:CBS domain-containing protein
MNLLDKISNVMITELVTLRPDDSLKDVAAIFEERKFHHIPVVDDNFRLKGMISKSDFLFFKRGFGGGDHAREIESIRMNNYTVSDIMTTKLAKVEPDDKINVLLEVFKVNLFHAIPVIGEDNKLVGIVTTYDIIKRLAEDKEATNEYNLK